MLIARQKRNENIAEYVLYMWQLEDIIRACKFDIEKIQETLVDNYRQTKNIISEIREWYLNISNRMKQEGLTEKGHMKSITDTVTIMNDLHLKLLKSESETRYKEAYSIARPNIIAFSKKSDSAYKNEIECCLTGLYAMLMLKLAKREISQETKDAMLTFSDLLALLSERYKSV